MTSQPTPCPTNALCDLTEEMAADMFPLTGSSQSDEGIREVRSIAARELRGALAGADAELVTFKDLAAGDEVYWNHMLLKVATTTTTTIPPHADYHGVRSTMARPLVKVTFRDTTAATELDYVPVTRLIRP